MSARNDVARHAMNLLLDAAEQWGKGDVIYRISNRSHDGVLILDVDVYDGPDSDEVSGRYLLELKITERS